MAEADRDRKIVDSGWGIKPDDQPANAADAGRHAVPVYRYDPHESNVVRNILRAQRRSFNTANRIRIEPGRTLVFDINKDAFVIDGLSYGDENLIDLLQHFGAAFDPQQIRRLTTDEKQPREFPLSRVWAWGA